MSHDMNAEPKTDGPSVEVCEDHLALSVSGASKVVTLRLALDETPVGPALRVPVPARGLSGSSPWEALVVVVNHLLAEDASGSEARLRAGEDVAWYDAAVWHPGPGDSTEAARAAWEGFDGKEALLAGDQVVIEDAISRRQMLFAKSCLMSILEALRSARAAAPRPQVPWLFRLDPYAFGGPGDGEEAIMAELEDRARGLDVASNDPDGGDPAEVASRRRFLLGDLEAAGLFDAKHRETKAAYLEEWVMPTLLSYLRAAEALEAYGTSEERKRSLPDATPPHPTRGPISLDWFRRGTVCPDGWTQHDWLSVCELWFLRSGVTEQNLKSEEIFVRLPHGTYRFDWRRDDGVHPALIAAHPA